VDGAIDDPSQQLHELLSQCAAVMALQRARAVPAGSRAAHRVRRDPRDSHDVRVFDRRLSRRTSSPSLDAFEAHAGTECVHELGPEG
jgi:hypothetical protein